MGCVTSSPAQEEPGTTVSNVKPAPLKSSDKDAGKAQLTGNPNLPGVKAEAIPKIPAVSHSKSTALITKSSSNHAAGDRESPGTGPAHRSLPPPGVTPGEGTGKVAKERRAAAGAGAVRDEIRKLGIMGGGPAGAAAPAVYEVSDSEDENFETSGSSAIITASKPQDITDSICEALKRNFVFKGIPESLLMEVVDRMYGVSFRGGSTVLQQQAVPKADDCMYFLQSGEAEVVISGTKPGWVFGDVALLFHSPRTASVVAKTNITAWAMDRKTFLQFVMKHAQGARALRFLRKLPLLKGLSDNDLIRAAARMPQRVYQDGQALIKYGERGDEMYLIRYGKVKVMRPDGKGGQVEAVRLGRGQFVGERAVINDRLRSADCVALGSVQVVVMKKRDFMELDNPLLAWMLDYDAVSTVLKALPAFKALKQEQMENILDRFDAREELHQGDVIMQQGDTIEKMFVVKIGEVQLMSKDNEVVEDPAFLKELGGFKFFGDGALQAPLKAPYSIVVASETIHLLCLPKRNLDLFLGGVEGGLNSMEAILTALKKSKYLGALTDGELKSIIAITEETSYTGGEVIATSNSSVTNKIFLVKSGEVLAMAADMALPGKGEVDLRRLVGMERQRLLPGAIFNDKALSSPETASLDASLVAAVPTTILSFTTSDVEKVLGGRPIGRSRVSGNGLDFQKTKVRFSDLELHRIVGTGQFGLVRIVRNSKNSDVYALKVMHKAPIVESKQIEHVINERRILEEANHPFCVKLMGAYQDKQELYLLQEWVAGGELFHHLDLEGAFDEPTAMFYAANVLMALEFLHNKGIVYRDLKPENLLLDTQGYIKMADFGFAKYIGGDKTYTICGTPDYQAPEVIMRRGTTKAADYWALGVLIFEMLVGDPPFKSLTGDPWDTFRRTLSGRFYVPNFISDKAADLIFKLLQVNPEKRLGSDPRHGADEIKNHPWFARLDWAAVQAKKLPAPIKPRIRNPLDTSNFDNFDNVDIEPPPIPASAREKHDTQWELWDWIE
ncbi:MAG: hypothetical protein WDW38_011373 [Sanguina aurantia]